MVSEKIKEIVWKYVNFPKEEGNFNRLMAMLTTLSQKDCDKIDEDDIKIITNLIDHIDIKYVHFNDIFNKCIDFATKADGCGKTNGLAEICLMKAVKEEHYIDTIHCKKLISSAMRNGIKEETINAIADCIANPPQKIKSDNPHYSLNLLYIIRSVLSKKGDNIKNEERINVAIGIFDNALKKGIKLPEDCWYKYPIKTWRLSSFEKKCKEKAGGIFERFRRKLIAAFFIVILCISAISVALYFGIEASLSSVDKNTIRIASESESNEIDIVYGEELDLSNYSLVYQTKRHDGERSIQSDEDNKKIKATYQKFDSNLNVYDCLK